MQLIPLRHFNAEDKAIITFASTVPCLTIKVSVTLSLSAHGRVIDFHHTRVARISIAPTSHGRRNKPTPMTSIRPLRREDIPEVASLYESVMRSGSRTPPPRLAAYFERTLLDHPWATAEIPSLVYETTDGAIQGFLASHVRRLRLNGEGILARYNGQLVADSAERKKGIGALLLRHSFAGPQDVTLTDGATTEVRQMWERLGGSTVFLSSLGWTRFFRPFRFAGDYLLARVGRPSGNAYLRPVWSAFDALAAKVFKTSLSAREPATRTEQLTPQGLLEHLPTIASRLRLIPDYDPAFLDWLFNEMARVTRRGSLVRRLVRDPSDRALGWYTIYAQPGGISEVQQVVAADRDFAAVMEHLCYDAWRRGAAALRGRLEARLFESVRRKHFYLRHEAGVLVHSRNSSLVNAILTGDALLTRMEGEWWMDYHIGSFA